MPSIDHGGNLWHDQSSQQLDGSEHECWNDPQRSADPIPYDPKLHQYLDFSMTTSSMSNPLIPVTDDMESITNSIQSIPPQPQSMPPQPTNPFQPQPDCAAFGFHGGGTFGNLTWPTSVASAFTPSVMYPGYGYLENYGMGNYGGMRNNPHIKTEASFQQHLPEPLYNIGISVENPLPDKAEENQEAVFSTDIDKLMRTIQAQGGRDSMSSEREEGVPAESTPTPSTSVRKLPRKRWLCEMDGCGKAFQQKTHLDIHYRRHSGDKPFECLEPGCGQCFSQLGNLKTHSRRHSGHRPYECEICGKAFAQHGNVRAHQIVHTNTKPYECKLEKCEKRFTQLGNLKSHQNRFHAQVLRDLSERFASMEEAPTDPWEKEMMEYFAQLYKNSNKGIKGRGKNRKISTATTTPSGSIPSPSYGMAEAQRRYSGPLEKRKDSIVTPGSEYNYRSRASSSGMISTVPSLAPSAPSAMGNMAYRALQPLQPQQPRQPLPQTMDQMSFPPYSYITS